MMHFRSDEQIAQSDSFKCHKNGTFWVLYNGISAGPNNDSKFIFGICGSEHNCESGN